VALGKWRISGHDVAIMAGHDPSLSASAAASHRARLRAYGLLASERRGSRLIHRSPLRSAAAGLLDQRPTIVAELQGPLHVDILGDREGRARG